MYLKSLAVGLVLALAASSLGCACHKCNTRVAAPPCCPPVNGAVVPAPAPAAALSPYYPGP
jgi:hypothetical protein